MKQMGAKCGKCGGRKHTRSSFCSRERKHTTTEGDREGCEGGRGGGRPPSDFRAGIPKRALDFVTSPEKRYKQNKIQNSESRGRNAAGRRWHGPVAPAVKWIPSVQQSQCRLSGFLSLLPPALSMSRGPLSSFTPSSPPPLQLCRLRSTSLSQYFLSHSLRAGFSLFPPHIRRVWVSEWKKTQLSCC